MIWRFLSGMTLVPVVGPLVAEEILAEKGSTLLRISLPTGCWQGGGRVRHDTDDLLSGRTLNRLRASVDYNGMAGLKQYM